VATTVIEVGVDVANATVMVIMDADRFGISQLHQLRGRVGRGTSPGLCLLVTESRSEAVEHRLRSVAATNDGFNLARLDLEQRQEGDVLGARQSGGKSQLRLLRLLRDEDLIVAARQDAFAIVEADPDLHEHPALRDAIASALDDEQAAYLGRG
jgi:ATP-dependent DNA helicase RecG